MSKVSKALILLGAASMATAPIAASAAGESLSASAVGGVGAGVAGAFSAYEIAGFIALLTSLGVVVSKKPKSK